MPSLAIAHRNPAVLATLTAQLQAGLGAAPEVLPTESDRLRSALDSREGGLVILDVDLVPVVAPLLRANAPFRLVAVTALAGDPRGAKLNEFGIPLLPVDQLLPYLLTGQAPNIAEPVPDEPGLLSEATPEPAASPAAETAPEPTRARLVVLHSAKGGAGTTTLAAHLAAAWAARGQHVALVDLTPYGGLSMLCKVQQSHGGMEGLSAALEQGPERLAAPEFDLAPYLVSLPIKTGRLDLLAGGGPLLLDRLKPTQVEQLLERMRDLPYHRVVVDTSAEPTPRNLATFSQADQPLLVAVPDYTCGWGLVQLKGLLEIVGASSNISLVLNRMLPGSGLSAEDLAARLNLPVVGQIPETESVRELNNHGLPWHMGTETEFGRAVLELTEWLDGPGEEASYG